MSPTPPNFRQRAAGFTLVEVLVALGIFVFAITAMMGVIPAGMKRMQAASNEGSAMTEMEAIRDDLALAAAANMAKSARFGVALPAEGAITKIDLQIGEDGAIAAETGIYKIAGSAIHPADGPVHLHLRATWPAKAPPGRETGSVELVAAIQP